MKKKKANVKKEVYVLFEECCDGDEFLGEFITKEALLLEMKQECWEPETRYYRVFKGVELDVEEESSVTIIEYDVIE